MPVSPLSNRQEVDMPKSQLVFLDLVVRPSCCALLSHTLHITAAGTAEPNHQQKIHTAQATPSLPLGVELSAPE